MIFCHYFQKPILGLFNYKSRRIWQDFHSTSFRCIKGERRSMFTLEQLNTIDRAYFHVFEASPFSVTLKSKNTRHYWKVNIEGNKTVLYHSHQGDGNYHVQCNVRNLESAMIKVKKHDTYQLRYRKKENNDYDYIPLLDNSDYFVF